MKWMRAMVLDRIGAQLRLERRAIPVPGPGTLRVRVTACGVCRTDLHVVDGDLPAPKLPLIPGHQVVGLVDELGPGTGGFKLGQTVGIPWLGGCCEACDYCREGRENLCDESVYTGYQIDGGFADYCIADPRFCFPIPSHYDHSQAAPLLCAGLIGFRAYRKVPTAQVLGLYGFGAAAHILIQVARYQGKRVLAFTRPGDGEAQSFARRLGAEWAGGSDQTPPQPMDAAIIFAPVGALVPLALRSVRKGGSVICAGIHMSDIPGFAYADLWGERRIESVANLTRADGHAFLDLAPKAGVTTEIHPYLLDRTAQALDDLRSGQFTGSAVIDLTQR